MLELPHALAGAAIATRISNPFLSLPLALASHFLLDLIPHWNPSLYTETQKFGQPSPKSKLIVYGDTLTSLIVGTAIAFQKWPDVGHFLLIMSACFLAVLPDLIEAPYYFFKYRPARMKAIIDWQRRYQGRAPKIPGILTQVAAVVLSLIVIFA